MTRPLPLGTSPGVTLVVDPLGARVRSLEVPTAGGRRNVVLGFEPHESDPHNRHFIGASIGRYANRIARGDLVVEGRTFPLGVTPAGHNLHGGPQGFDQQLWSVAEASSSRAVLTLSRPDGDQGFPGRVQVRATFTVEESTVGIEYVATTDAATVVNLTNHAYFNLDGVGDVLGHRLQVPADRFTPVDGSGIPLGAHAPVDGTPFDLREPALLSQRVGSTDPQAAGAGGLDHNLLVRGAGLRQVARLLSSDQALALEVESDQPGLQVYTGQGLVDGREAYAGVALEPQLYPDTPHHEGDPDWPSALLRPGETYRHRIRWRFVTG